MAKEPIKETPITPLMSQYNNIKAKVPGCTVAFQGRGFL